MKNIKILILALLIFNGINLNAQIPAKQNQDTLAKSYPGIAVSKPTIIRLYCGEFNRDTTRPLLYLVNDKIVKDISTISPDDIESITIIKKDSIIKLYGETVKNGIIKITLKK